MLGGERQVGLVNELAPAPTLGQTFEAARAKPTEQINLLAGYIFPGLSTDEQRKKSADHLSTIDEILNDPRQGYTQQGFNAIGNIIGSTIPTLPLAAAGGAIGAGIAGAIGFGARELALGIGTESALTSYLGTQVPLSKLATTAASHYLPEVGAGSIAANLTEAYGAYKGFIIPEHFAEHYDAINNALDTNHAIQDWASDNYGFLLGAAPLAAGYVAFKGVRGVIAHRGAIAESKALDAELTRLLQQHEGVLKENQIKEGEHAERVAKVSELQDHLEQAEEMGFITPEMHEWYLDYLENPNDMEKVHIGGLKILQALQIPYDRVSGRVWNEVISNPGTRNLKAALLDQGITNFSDEERQLLTQFVVHNEMDNYIGAMRDHPNMLNAIQGMTHSLEKKIAEQSLAIRNFDYALTKHLEKGTLKKQLFSQNNIYQHLKKIGVYSMRDVPYTVPKDVAYMLKLEKQIKDIKSQVTAKQKAQFERGEHLELRDKIKELKKRLLHPAPELLDIKNKLMPEGNLVSDFRKRKAYYRLEELSQVSQDAKNVLDRIHMEAENVKQKGLNAMLQKFTEMVDNTSARLADPNSVKRYLHTRIEKSVPFVREFEQSGIARELTPREVIQKEAEFNKPEIIYDEAAQEKVQTTELKHAKDYYERTKNKWEQFSKNTKALDDLIKCALGE